MPEGALSALTERWSLAGDRDESPQEQVQTPPSAASQEPQVSAVPDPQEPSANGNNLPEGARPLPYIPPDIPEEYRRPILQEDLSGAATGSGLSFGNYWLRNDAGVPAGELADLLETAAPPLLEEELRAPLFTRANNAVHLTQVGRELCPKLERMYQFFRSATDELHEIVDRSSGLLRLGVLSSLRMDDRLRSAVNRLRTPQLRITQRRISTRTPSCASGARRPISRTMQSSSTSSAPGSVSG